MHDFESQRLRNWFNRGRVRALESRRGTFDIFCIDENKNEKKAILLIHGFPTSSYDFNWIWSALAAEHRLITLDMLGFGFSEKPNNRDYTIHQQADFFESLIAELNVDSFHVVAHDYGVSVAQELLARQIGGSGKGRWLSCTFLNGGLFPETHRALLIQKIMLSPAGKWINKATGIGAFSKSFSSVFGPKSKPSKDEIDDFWELICYNQGRHLFHNLITYILDRREHRERWVNALIQSPIPLSLVNGSVDPVSGAHLVARYKELNGRLDHLVELNDIGHYPQVEAPLQVSDSILDFLSQTNLN